MSNASQPLANDIQPSLGPDTYKHSSAGCNTILVVEDEAFVREAACDILESEGYRVLRAGNSTEAHQAFHNRQGSVQLLLSDVVLPGQNGPALLKVLKATRSALKAIFISGYPEKTLARYGLTAGQMSYLPKPFSAESLLGKVRQVLESQELGSQEPHSQEEEQVLL